MTAKPLIQARDLRVSFQLPAQGALPWARPRLLHAVGGVDFTLMPGETLGIVGESGSGKSTLARALIGLVPATGQAIWQDGTDLIGLSARRMLKYRSQIQMVFQDPLASLNPRMTVGQIIAEPLTTHHKGLGRDEVKVRVKDMMDRVGLLPNQINRYPHEFSGGQCQRIGIARALIVQPKLVICDEPVSALDVSIQAQVINLLDELQRDLGLALIFIAHDLSVVKHISDRVLVMYLGRVMELAESQALYAEPRHPYTQALLSAVPIPDPQLERDKRMIPLRGELPSPMSPPSGCVFRTRCPRAEALCASERPALGSGAHLTACHFPGALRPEELAIKA
ncbi:oligopeptide/dipeptide ABC transporter ATP-binding protein [Paracoccus denitrificans]|jgi:oligopeptide transport system ATP-binding protein|uniref:Oligopeptide/dipeptide ABC transporter, ATPase subunit n=1 Tax=Paracoccus denitrificans (strain Pd 1222) TaxID=318586 RepID=A1B1N5_PARDP|nr:oligopeptide/dipeptide ABC transporter ATP-binding protein [Paracoccus denitrificans]ABL69429.1 oligopeptide/dipeptide ABC transporter, ATPase subunit [Paracoccus denitrificans PD1222]ABL69673.1 oligopeptide/dipeptide ABC transporter, ATPase subunit [Paracoccus denitrificans PD1222]MBB4630006.1 oligopeptide transport system ATP-binding protein [Paracoccus denitrificans]MCU7431075.1 ATP-binding cassette domain-containing protein [Paracoccus denitrificans]QAR24870.1 ATP-binding cassette domai